MADYPESLADDLVRVEALRDGLGPGGVSRVDTNAAWDIDTARVARAAGLPCVVSSALETSLETSAAQVALAGALPEFDFAWGLGRLSLLEGGSVSGAAALRPASRVRPRATSADRALGAEQRPVRANRW